ncbi:cytochrome c biogenesis protein ResB [Candidatus Acetothermia bacterium]|jgi:cytochrome c biogenesis protein|nr:cytochrome c biogenesis protein ResB [Candidatus Acetothermia bacterium]MCI2431448.1 cytochrome c biogenesis protein ResB [Candidatus Acetothermia bacterium]MCI2437132.1 cytochrome c biogenesis protein ResB [Candidatus Acetothermia bacterium]
MRTFFREIGQDLYRFFTSITLAIVLISLIALFSFVGTLIPQETFTREVDYIARFGFEGYQILKQLQLTDIFGSWYFLFVMALFTLNLTACTVKRLRASWRYWKLPMLALPPDALKRLEHTRSWEGPVTSDTVPSLERDLQRRGYRVRRESTQLLAEKWRWERFGIDLFHIALLVVIFGGLTTMLAGFRAFEIAHQGSLIELPGADFQLKVNRFWSENYEDTERVMDWHSEITVIENDREVFTQTIEVNAPLRYEGYNVYQSAFGTDWQGAARVTLAISRADGSELGEFAGTVDDGFEIPEEKLLVKVGAFLPDFALTENLIAYSRTQRLENPGTYIEIFDLQGTRLMRTWAFSRAEMQQFWESSMARVSGATPYRVRLVGMTAPEFTGLQITKDPGLPIVYFGFLLVVLGLSVHIYFKHQQIWVHFGESEIVIGGMARNRPRAFAQEFERLVNEIQKIIPKEELCATPVSSSSI